jgi:hypothetical protein
MNSTLQPIGNVNDLVLRIVGIGNIVVYLLVALAIVYIIYAVVQYFIKGNEGDESRRAAGMQIFYGIVGLAIIISLWGLVNLVLNTFWTNTSRPDLPNANFVKSVDNSSNAGVQQYSSPIGPTNEVQQYSSPIGPTNETQQYDSPIGPTNETQQYDSPIGPAYSFPGPQ